MKVTFKYRWVLGLALPLVPQQLTEQHIGPERIKKLADGEVRPRNTATSVNILRL